MTDATLCGRWERTTWADLIRETIEEQDMTDPNTNPARDKALAELVAAVRRVTDFEDLKKSAYCARYEKDAKTIKMTDESAAVYSALRSALLQLDRAS